MLLFSHSVTSDSLQPHEPQHTRPPCPSPSPRASSNFCPLSQWYHPTILSCVIPFSSCLQSFPASGSFPMSQLFAYGFQSIRASVLATVRPMNIQGWFSLGLTSLISLPKGLSRVFSNTPVQNHQFFGAQPLWSNSHLHRNIHAKVNIEGKTPLNIWLFCLLCFTFDFTLVPYAHNWLDYNAMAQNNN